MFQFTVEHSLCCASCERTTCKTDTHLSHTIHFTGPVATPEEDERPADTVPAMLAKSFESGVMDGNNQIRCDECGLQDGRKGCRVRTVPTVLCLTPAIKFYDTVALAYKLVRTEVIVPQGLHIALAGSECPSAKYDYDWASTVKFAGTANKGGHYTWSGTNAASTYNVNDDRVTKVDLDTALRCGEHEQVAMVCYKQRGGGDQGVDDAGGDQRGLMQLGDYGAQAPAIVPAPQASASAAAFPADVLYFLVGLLAHSAEDANTLRFRVSGVSKAWRRAASEAGKQARRALLPARTQTHTHAQKRTRTHTHARTRMHIVRMCACS
jgi:hypothetical protein